MNVGVADGALDVLHRLLCRAHLLLERDLACLELLGQGVQLGLLGALLGDRVEVVVLDALVALVELDGVGQAVAVEQHVDEFALAARVLVERDGGLVRHELGLLELDLDGGNLDFGADDLLVVMSLLGEGRFVVGNGHLVLLVKLVEGLGHGGNRESARRDDRCEGNG